MGGLRIVLRLVLLICVPTVAALITYGFLDESLYQPADPGSTKVVVFEVTKDHTFEGIAQQLEAKGLLKAAWSLGLIAKISKGQERITSGEYELSPGMRPKEILTKLTSGQVLSRPVTVVSGATVAEIGQVLAHAGILPLDEFMKAVEDPGLVKKAGIGGDSFEGYLFPADYQFARPITPQAVLWEMMEQGENAWPGKFTERADELRMSRHEILTLASIIEKESPIVEEMGKMSSVFHNRLKQGMKLQADATIRYAKGLSDAILSPDDLQLDSPYNTHLHFGLPPGPICNPGPAALQAALFPEESSYLYYLSDGNSGHVFVSTLEEYNKVLNQLQDAVLGKSGQ